MTISMFFDPTTVSIYFRYLLGLANNPCRSVCLVYFLPSESTNQFYNISHAGCPLESNPICFASSKEHFIFLGVLNNHHFTSLFVRLKLQKFTPVPLLLSKQRLEDNLLMIVPLKGFTSFRRKSIRRQSIGRHCR